MIARDVRFQQCTNEEATKGKAVLTAVSKVLDNSGTVEDVSLNELLDKAGVSDDAYTQGLQICNRGNSVVMQRMPSESWINTYNRDVIKVHVEPTLICNTSLILMHV